MCFLVFVFIIILSTVTFISSKCLKKEFKAFFQSIKITNITFMPNRGVTGDVFLSVALHILSFLRLNLTFSFSLGGRRSVNLLLFLPPSHVSFISF